MNFDIGPYDSCPCGSGAKYKFCCAAKAKDKRHGKYPIGTVALYGPDDKTTTKIAAGVILRDNAKPIIERWVATNVTTDEKVRSEIMRFFAKHGVRSVAVTSGNIGCPHEEGLDFPLGCDCPFCPFWAGKQGTARRDMGVGDWIDDVEFDDEEDLDFDDEDFDEDDEDWEEEDGEEDDVIDYDATMERIQMILGDVERTFDEAIGVLFDHLKANLQLPCEVTGIEDFSWEEPYIFGGWSEKEYEQLKKTQPSYDDLYELLDVEREAFSEWMMFDEDIAAHVRRISDGKEFILGLSELKTNEKLSPNHQLLEDYSVFLVNSR